MPDTLIFRRMTEPNEAASSILIPQGWQLECGLVRVNPMMQTSQPNRLPPRSTLRARSGFPGYLRRFTAICDSRPPA